MFSLSAAAILEKNNLASDGAWLILLEVKVSDGTVLRFVRNTENVIWNGETWVAFPFEFSVMGEESKGEIPKVTIQVSNVTRAVQAYLESADGGVGSAATLRVVHSAHLDQMSPELEEVYSVTGVKTDARWVTFTLGIDYPLASRRPARRNLKNFCPFRYGGAECGVSAGVLQDLPTCGKTLADCRQRGNSTRYGGEPSIPQGGLYAS
ncbi:DUF1833 family protein [Aminithiophilus ramosus]|uniref:DUF1833 family protein n=1 Tax=Aminithiophilus ramosus TaxID=3029084 RepID=A0A9Q7EZQ9_9BACT|nr:DUF1833 family protein [Aminithiophilus ramosus]QTX33206.1 DUF1833 family protein [Aminithiophilus ramosus]